MLIADTYINIGGAVLAGGENSRFNGKIKANMLVGNRSIIQNTLDLLDSIFSRSIIVSNYSSEFKHLSDYEMVSDIYKKVGPLGGIHAALKSCKSEALFIVAGDMPSLSDSLIRKMTKYFLSADCEVLIPEFDKYIEPLHAIYGVSILEKLDQFLSQSHKYSIREFLKLAQVEYFDVRKAGLSNNVFANINTPEDLERLAHKQEEKKLK